MTSYFNTINEGNKLTLNKGGDCDMVYYSELKEWFTGNAFRSFSLKYVVDKCIYYKVGNNEYEVNGGNFLLACRQPYVKAYFESKEIVKSICIDICSATVAEAFTIMSAKEDHDFDNYLAKYFRYPEFFESVCPVGSSQFKKKLNSLVDMIHQRETEADQQRVVSRPDGEDHLSFLWQLPCPEWYSIGKTGNKKGIVKAGAPGQTIYG